MSSRRSILDKITATLGPAGEAARMQAARARIADHRRHLIPSRVREKSDEALLGLLRGYLEGQRATVIDVTDPADVPEHICSYLRQHNLPARLRMGDDAVLAALPWPTVALEVLRGPAGTQDVVGLSRVLVGVAETGTLVLASGPENPVTITFLPDTHVLLLSKRDIVASYEDAWDRLRALYGAGCLPRTVNLVSGPSRTADIASIIVNGAHGPKALLVVLVP